MSNILLMKNSVLLAKVTSKWVKRKSCWHTKALLYLSVKWKYKLLNIVSDISWALVLMTLCCPHWQTSTVLRNWGEYFRDRFPIHIFINRIPNIKPSCNFTCQNGFSLILLNQFLLECVNFECQIFSSVVLK